MSLDLLIKTDSRVEVGNTPTENFDRLLNLSWVDLQMMQPDTANFIDSLFGEGTSLIARDYFCKEVDRVSEAYPGRPKDRALSLRSSSFNLVRHLLAPERYDALNKIGLILSENLTDRSPITNLVEFKVKLRATLDTQFSDTLQANMLTELSRILVLDNIIQERIGGRDKEIIGDTKELIWSYIDQGLTTIALTNQVLERFFNKRIAEGFEVTESEFNFTLFNAYSTFSKLDRSVTNNVFHFLKSGEIDISDYFLEQLRGGSRYFIIHGSFQIITGQVIDLTNFESQLLNHMYCPFRGNRNLIFALTKMYRPAYISKS